MKPLLSRGFRAVRAANPDRRRAPSGHQFAPMARV